MIFKALTMKEFNIILIIGCIFYIGACKKTQSLPNITEMSTPVTDQIHKCIWTSKDTGFFCGGSKNERGFIYQTIDGGKTWKSVYSSNTKSFYDIKFVNDSTAYCSGDKLTLLQSTNKGTSWKEMAYAFVPEYFNYVPMRCIFGDEKFLMIIGGENFDTGAVLWMIDGQLKWVWHFDHEFRSGFNFTYDNYLLNGYGNSYKTKDMGYTYQPIELQKDYYTSAFTINQTTGYACGYNGSIVKTSDAGKSWSKVLNENKVGKKRIHLNGICFNSLGNGFAVGNEGLLLKSENGTKWESRFKVSDANLLSISDTKNGYMIITCSNGRLLKVPY